MSQNSKDVFLTISPQGHKAEIRCLLLTNDKTKLVSGGDDKSVKIWDVSSGEIINEIYGEIGEGFTGGITCMALSKNNKYLAVGGRFNVQGKGFGIRIYDFATYKLIKVLAGHKDIASSVKFTGDDKKIISASLDSTIKLWDIETEKVEREYIGHNSPVYTMDVFENKIVSGDWGNNIMLWDLDKNIPVKKSKEHTGRVEHIGFSPNGEYIVSVAWDTTIILWDNTLKVIEKMKNHTMPYSFAFSPDGNKIAFGCDFPNLCNVYEMRKQKLFLYAQYKNHHQTVIPEVFYDNESVFTGGGEHNEIDFWKVSPNKTSLIKRFIGKGRTVYNAVL
ncbi:MAG TPA: WD40 repeat domain-containing protein, partial [Nitrosopumilaceae archaeon]|nr:WD40 repeat domain-containing protein [Nitrosopumilaceae archaeon]